MKDRFSAHANQYSSFRPLYPAELYEFIYDHVKEFGAAWDAGTGNGQAARMLAEKFRNVYATDISEKQLTNAYRLQNISYSVGAEKTELPGHLIDLVTVAQAIHWFDRDTFYREVKRVGKPGGVIAAWGYSLLSISREIDEYLQHFYVDVVGPYWDPERKLVDEHLKTIDFPFEEIQTPEFEFSFQWTQEEMHGYISTWSSVQKYIQQNGKDPVPEFMELISSMWGEKRSVTFPLFLRMGRI